MFIALSTLIFGASIITIETTNRQQNPVQQVVEQEKGAANPQTEWG